MRGYAWRLADVQAAHDGDPERLTLAVPRLLFTVYCSLFTPSAAAAALELRERGDRVERHLLAVGKPGQHLDAHARDRLADAQLAEHDRAARAHHVRAGDLAAAHDRGGGHDEL